MHTQNAVHCRDMAKMYRELAAKLDETETTIILEVTL
jgi:hypothetical protein